MTSPTTALEPASRPPLGVLLVVHDVRTFVRFREHLRSRSGRFVVKQVSGLEEALLRLREERHDLMLVDLDLPEAGGRDVLLRLRVAADELPIVALCDDVQSSLTTVALRMGVQDCLSRYEADPVLVERTVRSAFERHRQLRTLREARAREHHQATHDALTLLSNRQAFISGLTGALASASRRSSRLALLFFDLDQFKAVNDTLGHEVGDALLTEVGERLRAVTRQSDLVARLGGDEFVVALCNPDEPRSVMRAAEQFIEAVGRPYTIQGQECRVGVSIGVAFYPEDGNTAESLIRSADLAMYNAKETPGSSVRFYQEEMDREIHERFSLVAEVRESTRRRELFLEFQPQIDVVEERLVAAEALLRWLHPERGRLAPAEFLGIAEDTGMIQEIGAFALREACAAAAAWSRRPSGPAVAVNVSSRQLLDGRFAETVRSALIDSGLPPNRLVIEVTERGLLDRKGELRELLDEIAALGVAIAIDRFGVEVGSRLLQWPSIRMLKLDRSLLEEVGHNPRADQVVTALLALARSLGLDVVAGGIETESQLCALRALGCTRMQGFLLGVPVSGKELALALEDEERAPWREVLRRPALGAAATGPDETA